MSQAAFNPQTALKYEAEVQDGGRVEVRVPFSPGDRVVVFVIPQPSDDSCDLLAAAQTSLEFWQNPNDDEDWNHP
jgi:hypothetical protein